MPRGTVQAMYQNLSRIEIGTQVGVNYCGVCSPKKVFEMYIKWNGPKENKRERKKDGLQLVGSKDCKKRHDKDNGFPSF